MSDVCILSSRSDSILSLSPASLEEELVMIKQIKKARFTVYLAMTSASKRFYAIKFFPYIKNQPSPYFLNEARFSTLNHHNVISVHHIQEQDETFINQKNSSILMEYAAHGDLHDLISSE